MASDMPPAQEPYPTPQPYPSPGTQPYPPSPGYPGYPGYPPYQPYGAPPPVPQRGGFPWWGWLIGGCLGLVIIVGIACVVLGVVFGRLVSTFANETPVASTTTQTFTVTGAPSLTVHDPAGNVTVRTGDTRTVIVQITKNARDTSAGAAQNDLNSITVSPTQTGNAINVDANFTQATSPFRQLSVDLVITVPALADGSLIDLSAGNVTLDAPLAAGGSLTVTVNAGNVDLTLPASTAAHLDASVSFGNITIVGWSIPVTRSGAGGAGATASGDMGASPSGTLTVHVTAGNITLTAGG